MGQNFTANQLAALKSEFAAQGAGQIPGAWISSGSLVYAQAASGEFATSAQGTSADTAFGWGDHSTAGYLTAATTPQGYHDSVTGTGAETTLTLSATPVGEVFVIYTNGGTTTNVWREGTDYTISGAVITFVTVTPLPAGHTIDVNFIG